LFQLYHHCIIVSVVLPSPPDSFLCVGCCDVP
jgi:hypothetical protein